MKKHSFEVGREVFINSENLKDFKFSEILKNALNKRLPFYIIKKENNEFEPKYTVCLIKFKIDGDVFLSFAKEFELNDFLDENDVWNKIKLFSKLTINNVSESELSLNLS